MLAGYILVKGTISVENTPVTDIAANNNDKEVILRNFAPFCQINNTQIENAKDIDVVMPTCNWTVYRDNYLKTSVRLQ